MTDGCESGIQPVGVFRILDERGEDLFDGSFNGMKLMLSQLQCEVPEASRLSGLPGLEVVGNIRNANVAQGLSIGPHDAVLRRHRAWMATSAAKQAYKLRKQLVEPVFGIIKEQQGARRFLLRGLVNVAAEWTVLATAFNLRTLWRAWRSRAFIQLPHGPNLHPAS